MSMRVRFGSAIVKQVRWHLRLAWRCGDTGRVRRLTVDQLPSSSPDDHPIEHLWRHGKRGKTPNRSFPTFEALTQAVEEGLSHFQTHPAEVKHLMGTDLEAKAACPQAA